MKKPKVAMITTWNNKCGIAEYTRLLCHELEEQIDFTIFPNYDVRLIRNDESNVAKRLWHSSLKGDLNDLCNELKKNPYDILHFQYGYMFYKLIHLTSLINELHNKYKIIITLHETNDKNWARSLESIKDQLNLCYRLIVHQFEDKNRLIKNGIDEEIIDIIPLGQIIYPYIDKTFAQNKLNYNRSLVIGSYGFLLPHKGIKENIESFAIIKKQYPDVLYIVSCALYESADSLNYLVECQKTVNQLNLTENVVFITEFLSNDECIKLLQACDVLLMAYHHTEQSASGAMRFCVAALRPIITTRQNIFNEFSECTYQIDNCNPVEIAEAVFKIKKETELAEILVENMKKQINETNWERVGKLTYSLYVND